MDDREWKETVEYRLQYLGGQIIAQNSLQAGLLRSLLSREGVRDTLRELIREPAADRLERWAKEGPGIVEGYRDYMGGIREQFYEELLGDLFQDDDSAEPQPPKSE